MPWGCYPRTAACIPPPNPSPSRVDDSDVEARKEQAQAITWLVRECGLPEEDAHKLVNFTKDSPSDVDEVVKILDRLPPPFKACGRRLEESVGAPLIPVERNRKKENIFRQQHSRS